MHVTNRYVATSLENIPKTVFAHIISFLPIDDRGRLAVTSKIIQNRMYAIILSHLKTQVIDLKGNSTCFLFDRLWKVFNNVPLQSNMNLYTLYDKIFFTMQDEVNEASKIGIGNELSFFKQKVLDQNEQLFKLFAILIEYNTIQLPNERDLFLSKKIQGQKKLLSENQQKKLHPFIKIFLAKKISKAKSKNLAIADITENCAHLGYFTLAKNMAQLLKNETVKSKALRKVVKVYVRDGFIDQAKQVLPCIKNVAEYNLASKDLVKVYLKLEKIAEVKKIIENTGECSRDKLYRTIINAAIDTENIELLKEYSIAFVGTTHVAVPKTTVEKIILLYKEHCTIPEQKELLMAYMRRKQWSKKLKSIDSELSELASKYIENGHVEQALEVIEVISDEEIRERLSNRCIFFK